MVQKRELEILVLSDIHLGTYGCHAAELLQYLHTIQPKMVVLNGDIVDIWQFNKRYWPPTHMAVMKHIMKWIDNDIPVYYLPGNHDEMLRKFIGFQMGSLKICNKLSLRMQGQRIWIFHGDVFDVVMEHSKWLARLGAKGYDMLILINRVVNWSSEKLGRGKISFSKKIKDGVKSAVKFISRFEETVAEIATEHNYQMVICGHIHQPVIKTIESAKGKVNYLNSGDWIENLTALECENGNWHLYVYHNDPVAKNVVLRKSKRSSKMKDTVLPALLNHAAGKSTPMAT